jgi:hypothetical protein
MHKFVYIRIGYYFLLYDLLPCCMLRLPGMALLLGFTSAVCRNDSVIWIIGAVCSTKIDNLTNTLYRNTKEVCNLIKNCHQNLKTYLLEN